MEENMNSLTQQEEKFCLLYVEGPSPYAGNADACYKVIYKKPEIDDDNPDIAFSLSSSKLIKKQAVSERIKELQDLHIINSAVLRPRITQTLLKVMDECSKDVYEDKFGNKLSPAALRSVSVAAAKELNDMYGIKEDIAHTVKFEGNDGGITFNVIAPQQRQEEGEEANG